MGVYFHNHNHHDHNVNALAILYRLPLDCMFLCQASNLHIFFATETWCSSVMLSRTEQGKRPLLLLRKYEERVHER